MDFFFVSVDEVSVLVAGGCYGVKQVVGAKSKGDEED
jgi:hypothetical protein